MLAYLEIRRHRFPFALVFLFVPFVRPAPRATTQWGRVAVAHDPSAHVWLHCSIACIAASRPDTSATRAQVRDRHVRAESSVWRGRQDNKLWAAVDLARTDLEAEPNQPVLAYRLGLSLPLSCLLAASPLVACPVSGMLWPYPLPPIPNPAAAHSSLINLRPAAHAFQTARSPALDMHLLHCCRFAIICALAFIIPAPPLEQLRGPREYIFAATPSPASPLPPSYHPACVYSLARSQSSSASKSPG